MRRTNNFSIVALVCIFCAAPALAKQHTRRTARKPVTKTATKPADVPEYPYMQAVKENALGLDFMDQKQYANAFAKFQTACVMDIESDVGCQNAGIALVYMQNYDDARKMLQKSVDRNPQYANAWLALGILEQKQNNLDAAIANFEKAAAADPADGNALCLIGLLRMQQKKTDQAIDAFANALRADPTLVSAELGLAQADLQMNDTKAVLEHLNRLQYLTASDSGHTVDFAYGKAGKLSFAEKIVPPQPSAAATDATATPATSSTASPSSPLPPSPLPRAPRGSGAPYPLTPKDLSPSDPPAN